MKLSTLSFFTIAFAASFSASADAPADYYDSVSYASPAEFKMSLHNIIRNHTRFPYTSNETDTWDILKLADQHPELETHILDVYKNASYEKQTGGNDFYNREHVWPKSYGFPDNGDDNYPYTDAHHLFLSDSDYNTARSNKPYENCSDSCQSLATDTNNSQGGTEQEANFTKGQYTEGSWQTWSGRQGDVARALMYMAVRYQGGQHSFAEQRVYEPDLELTDVRSLIEHSRTGQNELVAYMGMKSVLLEWHKNDPVDDIERNRNDVVFQYQGNRNPFIDHPEWAECALYSQCESVIENSTDDTQAPEAIEITSAQPGIALHSPKSIALEFTHSTSDDIYGYKFYYQKTGSEHVNFHFLRSELPTMTSIDNLEYGQEYTVWATAVDKYLNESTASVAKTVTIKEQPAVVASEVWINELHYQNTGEDSAEFIEIAGPINTDMTGWQIELYNGTELVGYNSVSLNGVLTNDLNGIGFMSIEVAGILNDGPHGIALINPNGEVAQFISYGGTLTPIIGAALDIESTDIGVQETDSTAIGVSLQLVGDGSVYSDFEWQANVDRTAGAGNLGQSIGGVASAATVAANAAQNADDTPEEKKSSGSMNGLLLMAGGLLVAFRRRLTRCA